MTAPRHDVAVVGGGIVGLAAAMALLGRDKGARVIVLEKERRVAAHQTGRNSGVIHSGIYYRPGSEKARCALEGSRRLPEFCREHGIPCEITGKLIVATEPAELPLLDALLERGRAHGIPVRRLGPEEIREREPHAAGLAAIHVPTTGITDYRQVAEAMGRIVALRGGEVRLGARVTGMRHQGNATVLETDTGEVEARFVVGCAGLHADRVARQDGVAPSSRIVPFRGEYYRLVPARRALVRNLIYPVPDPAFPFLGVHLTRGVDGEVHAGPNAVPALAREGYRWRDIELRDLLEMAAFPGVWRLLGRHWRHAAREAGRSLSRAAFARSLQRLVPTIAAPDLLPAEAGVRAQALGQGGDLVDDFLIVRGPRSLHVLNAPSPAATGALPIGEIIAAQVPGRAAL